jgi:hypothetical protein
VESLDYSACGGASMLTYRVTYYPDGTRHFTFLGRDPKGHRQRLTLRVPEPGANHNSVSKPSTPRRAGKPIKAPGDFK